MYETIKFQHTAARRRLHQDMIRHYLLLMFQHTAARRRLRIVSFYPNFYLPVSTHSRPKAAAAYLGAFSFINSVSTHSRPKAAAALHFR